MIFHLDPGGLRGRPLTPAEREHLAACPRCRVDVRLYAVLEDDSVPELPANRYIDLGLLGRGGMGEVRRVYDRVLAREVALKLLPAFDDAERVARFEREARVTAGLQHPGIAPVLDAGTLPDGRPWYTMRIITGDTLAAVLAAREGTPSVEAPATRRLVEIVLRAAEAVGYAHRQGVLHRDLKPANIVRGALGEVVVLDWGLARRIGAEVSAVRAEAPESTDTLTMDGTIAGTMAYMPPEQARGDIAALGPAADTWALGAILREVATGGRVYGAAAGEDLYARAREGEVDPLPDTLSSELGAILARSLAPAPDDRYPDAIAFGEALQAWLDGAWRRDRALAHVARADEARLRMSALRADATAREALAREALEGVRPYEPVERKRGAWAQEDAARQLRVEAEEAELAALEELRAALAVAPDLPEARLRLADHYAERHASAEAARDDARAAFLARQLRAADDGRYARRLQAEGTVAVRSDPPGAEVVARRYERRDRRLVPGEPRWLGHTPLEASLPAGSWLLELRHGGHAQVYPVLVERDAVADAVRPGATEPTPVPLGLRLHPDDVLVAAGWFYVGGDPEATSSLPRRRLWADAFVMRRHPVTNAEYLAFLDDLVRGVREDEAIAHAPRERSGTFGEAGALIYGRHADGGFALVPDAEGDRWEPDWPVVNVAMAGALAYAAWLGAREGLPWRLPMELEWEKAARGADGRAFPWGDFLDPTWANVRETHPGRALPSSVHAFPTDESPWGVRGMAGNVRDRCLDLLVAEGPVVADDRVVVAVADGPGARSLKGGSFGDVAVVARAATRTGVAGEVRGGRVGFRVVRSV
ncbi:MAG: bifunctional serine/threonine-protein kinase/formylglycine-generating enzyme family protein [Pseudomonadota bacterium]|nr:bifunctional serine/threonine-protein kinase/formylglycine-generating enzyme family protein [Pseudomonadota bacterium]